MKTALYARYSSDLQRDRSIEDQFALLDQIAARENWQIVQRFADRALSGTSRFGRDGLTSLMEQAAAKSFSILLTESLDRLSRDQEDMAGIYKRLSFFGVRIVTANEGTADEIHVGVRSIVSSLYIQDLRHKVRRGMAGVVRDGRKPGGVPYGYRCIPGRPGELEIQEEEAEIVRRLFREYLEGASPHRVAIALNAEGVPSAHGRGWMAPAINVMLRNPIYSGRLVWGRKRALKNPETGRTILRSVPPVEWQHSEVPDLALVDQRIFDAAQEVRARLASVRLPCRRRPPHMLSGLLKCGQCGASMISKGIDRNGKRRVRCYAADHSLGCAHGRRHYAEDILAQVMGELRKQLQHPEAIKAALSAYREERARLAKQRALSATRVQNELAAVGRRIANIIAALADGLESASSVRESLLKLEADRERLAEQAEKAKAQESVVSLHPQAVERYLGIIDELSVAGTYAPQDRPEVAQAFRVVIEAVIVHPDRSIEIRTQLASLLCGGCGYKGEALYPFPPIEFTVKSAA